MISLRTIVPLLLLAIPLAAAVPPAAPVIDVCGPRNALDPAACEAALGPGLVTMPDGSRVFTHGGDPIPTRPLLVRAAAGAPQVEVACVSASEPHLRAVYVTPNGLLGSAQRFEARRPLIVASLLQANAEIFRSAERHGADIRMKMLCDANGQPRVDFFPLAARAPDVSLWTIASELGAAGIGHADEKVITFYDGSVACNCGGQAYIPGGDWASPDNSNNYGWWSYGAIYLGNYGVTNDWAIDEVVLHEITHFYGGVQWSAPNTTGGAHCIDGWDIMCYDDDGPHSHRYANTACTGGHGSVGMTMPYDCNNDDYFHPSPAPGSYLATHWNIGAQYFRFLQHN